MTVKPCNEPAVGAYRLGYMEFIDVFSVYFNTYYAWSTFPGSVKADVG